jgi:hypothetical protein
MQALLFDVPRHPTVAAAKEPRRGRGHYDAGTVRVRANLVDVALDVDGRLPGCAAVGRARDAADVDVGEEDHTVRRCGDRADPERRSQAPTVDDCRARIPCLTPGDRVEAAELLECSVLADAQNAGIEVATSTIGVVTRASSQRPFATAANYSSLVAMCGGVSVPLLGADGR